MSNKNLVFVHGNGMNRGALEPIAERFSNYKVHLINLPGHGVGNSELPKN